MLRITTTILSIGLFRFALDFERCPLLQNIIVTVDSETLSLSLYYQTCAFGEAHGRRKDSHSGCVTNQIEKCIICTVGDDKSFALNQQTSNVNGSRKSNVGGRNQDCMIHDLFVPNAGLDFFPFY